MFLKYLIAFLLIMHGLAHVTGLMGAFSSGEQAFEDRPWIFSQGVTARGLVGKAWALCWLLAAIGLVTAGVGLLFGWSWWLELASVAAMLSLVAIVPWLRVVPPGAWAGGLLDLCLIVALLAPWTAQIVEALQ
jgi:hypothetical protein